MLSSRHPGEAQRGDITCQQLTSTACPHRRRPRRICCLPDFVGQSQPQPGGASRPSAAASDLPGPADRGGDGGGRSAWWSASRGRDDPCFVAVALHAVLIGVLIGGRTYRVASSRRCGYQLFRFLEPTTGWVLVSGTSKPNSPMRSTPRSPAPSSSLSDHDAGTTSQRVRGTLDWSRARMPQPRTT